MEGASLKHISEVKGLPIFDLQTSEELGEIEGCKVEPRSQKIVAFCIKKGAWLTRPLFLAPTDVVEYDDNMVVVRSQDSLTEAGDIVGLNELPKKGFGILGCAATTQSGVKLGTVKDFTFEVVTSQIQQYMVGTTKNDLIIKADRVVTVQPNRIIFTDDITLPTGASVRKEVNLA